MTIPHMTLWARWAKNQSNQFILNAQLKTVQFALHQCRLGVLVIVRYTKKRWRCHRGNRKRNSENGRQYNDQNKTGRRHNNCPQITTKKPKDWATRTSLKIGDELRSYKFLLQKSHTPVTPPGDYTYSKESHLCYSSRWLYLQQR